MTIRSGLWTRVPCRINSIFGRRAGFYSLCRLWEPVTLMWNVEGQVPPEALRCHLPDTEFVAHVSIFILSTRRSHHHNLLHP